MRGLIRVILPLVLVAAAGAGAAMATTAATHSTATVRAAKSSFGTVLIDSSGRTLYRYTPDTKGHSVCTGACLAYWPQLLVKASTKPTVGAGLKASLVGTIKAAKGMRQVTYAGWPLYRFKGDTKAGQFKGQGYDGTWYVVGTNGALIKKAAGGGGGDTTTSSGGTTTSKSAWG